MADSLYNSPSVKNSRYSVLSGDQSFLSHRDPKAEAEISLALATLEFEGLIQRGDLNRLDGDPSGQFYKITAKGYRLLSGTKGISRKEILRLVILITSAISLLVILLILFF